MNAAAPPENKKTLNSKGPVGCESKKNYCLDLILDKTDSTVLAFLAAFLTDSFNSSSYLIRTRSIPSAIKALMAVPVSRLMSFSNSYLTGSTRILVFTSSELELGILSFSPYFASLLSTSVTIFTSNYLTLTLFLLYPIYKNYYKLYFIIEYSKVVNYILKEQYSKSIKLLEGFCG